MEFPDVTGFVTTEKPRKYSVSQQYTPDPDDIEQVTIVPSTELIADEYEHEDNKKGLVLIFHSQADLNAMAILKTALSDQGYDVPEENIHRVTSKQSVLNILQDVAKRDHVDRTCFILIFMGNSVNGGQFLLDEPETKDDYILIREVWSHFTSNNCPTLRYRPKIFIFQACEKLKATQYDGIAVKVEHPRGAYDIPAEADMLLVYKTITPWARADFIVELSNNFNENGRKDDIIGVITHTYHKNETRPLIISTLTRKFFISPSRNRRHYYDLHKNHSSVTEILNDLTEKIKVIEEQQSTLKRKLEHKGSFRRSYESPVVAHTSTVAHADNTTAKNKETPKLSSDTSDSKKVSRTPSAASSVEPKAKLQPKPKPKVTVRQPWR